MRLIKQMAKPFAVVSILILLGLACTPKQQPAPTSTPVTQTTVQSSTTSSGNLASLQQSRHITASFSGMVAFQFNGNTVTYASQFFIPSVPLTWSGTSFSGRLEENGPGEDITDEVSGIASADGAAIQSLVYSRNVIRNGAGNGAFYQLTLQNLLLTITNNGAVFEKSGAGLQNNISKIEYMAGPLVNGSIAPDTTYVSTNWGSTTPTLKVTFIP